jgi:hypothetical protein
MTWHEIEISCKQLFVVNMTVKIGWCGKLFISFFFYFLAVYFDHDHIVPFIYGDAISHNFTSTIESLNIYILNQWTWIKAIWEGDGEWGDRILGSYHNITLKWNASVHFAPAMEAWSWNSFNNIA